MPELMGDLAGDGRSNGDSPAMPFEDVLDEPFRAGNVSDFFTNPLRWLQLADEIPGAGYAMNHVVYHPKRSGEFQTRGGGGYRMFRIQHNREEARTGRA